MEKFKFIFKHQQKIIECLFVSLIGGWMLSSITRGVFTQISNIEYCAKVSFPVVVVLMLVFAGTFGVIFYLYEKAAKISMFAVVYIFTVLCAFNGYDVQWGANSYNTIGNVCFLGVLCFVSVLAFNYVKDDIFGLFRNIKIKKRTANIILILIGIAIFLFVGIATALRYMTYSNSTFDFGIFAQMYEYMKQKGTMETTVERNYLLSHFGVHFSPIFYVGLPIYYIFSSPITVQLIQAVMIALPVIPIALLCRKYKMSHWMTIAVSLLYVLYPVTAGGAMYDIHENCFLTFLILMSIWAIEKKKNILTTIFVLLTFLVKEDAAVYILVLGTYFLFSRRDKKRGIILMVVSLIYFGVAVTIVNSYGLGILDNRLSNLYFDSNSGMGQIIQTILANPAYVLGQTVTNATEGAMDKIEYLMIMIIPVAAGLFITGKKYSRYILLAPFIVLNIFTTYVYLHSITFQYNFGVIALFVYLIIMNMSDLKVKKAKSIVSVSVICAGIMFAGLMFPKYTNYLNRYSENKASYDKINEAMDIIPSNASVSASGFFIPHLYKHLELYDQNHVEEDVYTDYLVVDKRYEDETSKFENILASGQYESVYDVDGIVQVYHKKQQ